MKSLISQFNSPLHTGQHRSGTFMGFLHLFTHVGVISETIPSYDAKKRGELKFTCTCARSFLHRRFV